MQVGAHIAIHHIVILIVIKTIGIQKMNHIALLIAVHTMIHIAMIHLMGAHQMEVGAQGTGDSHAKRNNRNVTRQSKVLH